MTKRWSISGIPDFAAQLLRRLLDIVEIASLRRLDQRQEDALVLLGRKLARGRHVHDRGQRQHADEDQKRQRAEIEGAVQPALIGAAQPLERPVDETAEPVAPPCRGAEASSTSSATASAR